MSFFETRLEGPIINCTLLTYAKQFHGSQASLSVMVHYDAFATLDTLSYKWYIKMYMLTSHDVDLSPDDFRPLFQRATPMEDPEVQVWPTPRGGGGSGGGRRGRGRGRRGPRRAGGRAPPQDDEGPSGTEPAPPMEDELVEEFFGDDEGLGDEPPEPGAHLTGAPDLSALDLFFDSDDVVDEELQAPTIVGHKPTCDSHMLLYQVYDSRVFPMVHKEYVYTLIIVASGGNPPCRDVRC